MRMRLLALLLLLPLLAQAQMYRWVDKSGEVHYSDRLPPSGAKNVQEKSLAVARDSSPLPYALQQAVKNFPVSLYTSDTCKDTCAQARAFLKKRGVPYSEHTVADEADIAQLKKLSGDGVVPVMTVGREVYKGFESGTYKVALDIAGYPASSLLPPGVDARKLIAKPAPKAAPAATDTEATRVTRPQGGAPVTAPQDEGAPAESATQDEGAPATRPQEGAPVTTPQVEGAPTESAPQDEGAPATAPQ